MNSKELRSQILGHITRLECTYYDAWNYQTDTYRGILIGIGLALEDDYINERKTLDEVIAEYNKLGKEHMLDSTWFDFKLDYAYSDEIRYAPNKLVTIINKQNEFMTFVFETLYNKLEDGQGNKLLTIHQYDINNLMKNMFSDLGKLMDVFGCIMPDDVVKAFVIHFWDKDKLIQLADEEVDLTDIAYKFDELFGDMIGDKPTFD
jgi:hypothetical protein